MNGRRFTYLSSFFSLLLTVAFLVRQIQGAPSYPSRPNILLIVVDDLRPALGFYGDQAAKTPSIDSLARRGVRFDRAYCQYPICGPSRVSFLTGLRPETTGYYGWGAPTKFTYLPTWFKRHGYFTAEFGKVFHVNRLLFDDEREAYEKRTGKLYQPVFRTLNPPGCWDVSDLCATADDPGGYGYSYGAVMRQIDPQVAKYVAARGSLRPKGLKGGWYWMEWAETKLPDAETSDGIVARRAAAAMEEATRQGRPFLVAAGIRRPHQVLAAPQKYFERHPLASVPRPQPEPREHLDKLPPLALTHPKELSYRINRDDRQRYWHAYHANVSFVDGQVGVLLETLDRLKLWDKTIVVLFSDHGLHLGEHGGLCNKDTLFEEATRVPLLVAATGFRSGGQASTRPVESIDIFPTLTDLSGLPAPSGMDGKSLRPLLVDPEAQAPKPGAFSVVRRHVNGKRATGFSGFELQLREDAGPERFVLGRSIRTEGWRYTEWEEGKLGVELYDESEDPRELNNLAGDPEFAHVQAQMKLLLRASIFEPTPVNHPSVACERPQDPVTPLALE